MYSQVLKAIVTLQAVHSESQRDQFLMKLRSKFENTRAELINLQYVLSFKVCLAELLCEEKHIASHLGLVQGAGGSEMINMAYAVQDRGRSRSLPQCYSCKKSERIAKYFSKKSCNYCKKENHIIKDCHVCP